MGTVCTLNSPTGLAQSSNSNQRPVTCSYFAKRCIALSQDENLVSRLGPVGFETEAAVRESKDYDPELLTLSSPLNLATFTWTNLRPAPAGNLRTSFWHNNLEGRAKGQQVLQTQMQDQRVIRVL